VGGVRSLAAEQLGPGLSPEEDCCSEGGIAHVLPALPGEFFDMV